MAHQITSTNLLMLCITIKRLRDVDKKKVGELNKLPYKDSGAERDIAYLDGRINATNELLQLIKRAIG